MPMNLLCKWSGDNLLKKNNRRRQQQQDMDVSLNRYVLNKSECTADRE